MMRLFELQPVDGSQVVDLNHKFEGLLRIVTNAPTSTGTVQVEYKLRDFDAWAKVPNGA